MSREVIFFDSRFRGVIRMFVSRQYSHINHPFQANNCCIMKNTMIHKNADLKNWLKQADCSSTKSLVKIYLNIIKHKSNNSLGLNKVYEPPHTHSYLSTMQDRILDQNIKPRQEACNLQPVAGEFGQLSL